jgi:superfamily II DNA or RNA helicase
MNSIFGWKLKYRPRDWQVEAINYWKESYAGIVKVVTGGGKTIFAQLCILEFFNRYPNGQVLIVVPTVALLDQWYISLQDELFVQPNEIGLLSGREKIDDKVSKPIVVAVLNSARNYSKKFAGLRPTFLIVDECHRAGSLKNSQALEGDFVATLGLSATPEREYDSGFEDFLVPKLGPVIYSYSYKDAAKDEILSKFTLINVRFDLLPDEDKEYKSLTRRIAMLMEKNVEENQDKIKRLLLKRASVISSASMRIPIAVKIAEMNKGEKTVIFHEKTSSANSIYRLLLERGHSATIYHTGLGPALRRENLRMFRKGMFDFLVCCRALDEGLNIPEASVGIIASSTASSRQRIQRLGRILRKAKGKENAVIYTLYATQEEYERLAKEAASFSEIATVSWQVGGVNKHF